MNKRCPVCDEVISCFAHSHALGKYNAHMYNDRSVYVWCGGVFLIKLDNSKRLTEKYIDMILLLK